MPLEELVKLDITKPARILRDPATNQLFLEYFGVDNNPYRIPFNLLIAQHHEQTYLPSQVVTTNGDSGATPLIILHGSVVVFFLDVTGVSGTSPTLDVYIDIQDPASGKWVNQDKFTATPITTTGTWAIALQVRSTKYRIRWVLGGTNPSFTFSVGVVIIK
jgi:hypothetical protein